MYYSTNVIKSQELDEGEFSLHVFEKLGLGFELRLGFINEFLWRLFDVVWIAEASFKGVDFLAELQDAILEVCLVFGMNILWNLEIDVWVAGDSEMKTLGVFWLNLRNGWCFREMLEKKLIIVDEFIVVEGDWVAASAWEALEVASDVCNDRD